MNPPADELQQVWIADTGDGRTDMPELVEQLKRKSFAFDRMLGRCTVLLSISGASLAGIQLWLAFQTSHLAVRAVRLWMAGFFLLTTVFVSRYMQVSRKPAAVETLTAYRESLLRKYDRQLRLLGTIQYWYLLPLWLGQMTLVIAYLGQPKGGAISLVLAILFTVINAGVWWVNNSKGVKPLRRERERLLALTRENSSVRLIIGVLLLLAAIIPGDLRAAEYKVAVDRLVQPVVESGAVIGVVVGLRRGDHTEIYGYGKPSVGRPGVPTGATVFEIGSTTKVFTALALADMAERGMVALDDPVRKYLPAGTVPAPNNTAAEIRLVDLATHTSGLPRMPTNWKPANPANPYADYSPEKLYAFLSTQQLLRKPDTGYSYSNLGAGLLGHVLARRGGVSYERLVCERLTQPLGMKDTTITLSGDLRARLAEGHDADGELVANWDMDALAGAGAIRSTASDLLQFAAANLNPPEVLRAAIEATHCPRAKTGTPAGDIALGWHVRPNGRTYWHNGATAGYGSYLSFNTRNNTAVVVLINTGGPLLLADQVGTRVEKLLAGEAPDAIPVQRPTKLEGEALDALCGNYELAGTRFVIRREGDHLRAEQAGQPPMRLYPESETVFFLRTIPAKVTFRRNDAGEVLALEMERGGAHVTARRAR